jgi:glutamyl-tRNA synthetase
MWLNGNYIRETDDKRIASIISDKVLEIIKYSDSRDLEVKETEDITTIIKAIIPSIKIRLKTLNEAWSLIRPFFYEIDYNDDIRVYFDKKEIDAAKVLDTSIEELEKINDESFSSSEVETTLRSVSETLGIKFRKTAEVVRLAVWAAKVSPPMFESIAILGKKRSIDRLKTYREIIT